MSKTERRTFAEVATAFLKECRNRSRRRNTLAFYDAALRCYLLPKFGPHEVGTIRKSDIAEHFDAMRDGGATVQTVNRALRTMKAVLFFALDRDMVEKNVMHRFKPYEGATSGCSRDAFNESEVRAILAAARPHERALIGLLCFTGLRPGEAYALQWSDVKLDAGQLSVLRSWDYRGQVFVEPKTKAGIRQVPLSGWLVAELVAHKERSSGEGLVFASRTGSPMNPSNVRRDIWLKLRARAGVRALDLYSMRHTFASLARSGGEAAFNVSRMMGHSRSTLVDQVYAHSMQSGLAGVAESVTNRALGVKPQLRVIEGGQRDVRETLDEACNASGEKAENA